MLSSHINKIKASSPTQITKKKSPLYPKLFTFKATLSMVNLLLPSPNFTYFQLIRPFGSTSFKKHSIERKKLSKSTTQHTINVDAKDTVTDKTPTDNDAEYMLIFLIVLGLQTLREKLEEAPAFIKMLVEVDKKIYKMRYENNNKNEKNQMPQSFLMKAKIGPINQLQTQIEQAVEKIKKIEETILKSGRGK